MLIPMPRWLAIYFILVFSCWDVTAEVDDGIDIHASYCYKKSTEYEFGIGWICETTTQRCVKSFATKNITSSCLLSLNVCKLLCDSYGSLWPKPTQTVQIKKKLIPIDSGKIAFKLDTPGHSNQLWNMLEELEHYYLNVISTSLKNLQPKGGSELIIVLKVKNENQLTFSYSTIEHYRLTISASSTGKRVEVTIEGENYFAVRHGVETLTQLIVYDDFSNSILIPQEAVIEDEPVYKHRGVLLDTARSFYSVKSIKRTLDAMAQNKLNSFHWHLTDSQSFPFQSKTYPLMSRYGSYSPSKIYSWTDIREIVKYARIRGIRVIPEFDAPSHVGEGWQFFENHQQEDNVLLCFNAEPWRQYCVEPPCGILNPINPRVYEILNNLYSEYNQLFDSDVFHMGGDEVSFYCWKNTPSIVEWINKQNKTIEENTFMELWSYFQTKALEQYDKTARSKNTPIILWTSTLTQHPNVSSYLDKNRYIIQIWTTGDDRQIFDLLKKGYNVIFSNYDALYFDCGFGAWIGEGNNWCSPYIGWQKVYMNDPKHAATKLYQRQNDTYDDKINDQILGAEAALWSEQSDDSTIDNRLWPRSSALAERLWSNPTTDWQSAESRFLTQRERMLARGINPDMVEPLWCHQNEKSCY